MRLYTKAVLRRLLWTAALTLVAVCAFLAAMYAGLPQMPTVGCILVALVVGTFVLGRLLKSTDTPDRQERG